MRNPYDLTGQRGGMRVISSTLICQDTCSCEALAVRARGKSPPTSFPQDTSERQNCPFLVSYCNYELTTRSAGLSAR